MTGQQRFTLTKQQRQQLKQEFARQCFHFRQRFLLTQVKLAEMLGVSRRAYQYHEAAAELPSMHTRQKFAELQREFARREKASGAA
jgi:DNA-binding XRE family transcriptional regulator